MYDVSLKIRIRWITSYHQQAAVNAVQNQSNQGISSREQLASDFFPYRAEISLHGVGGSEENAASSDCVHAPKHHLSA